MTARPSAEAALHVAVLLFGFAGLFGKWVDLPPASIVLGRTAFAAATLALLLAARRRRVRPSPRLLGNGLVLAVHWVTFFEAIRVSSVAIGLLGYASFPLFVLVLERLALGAPLTPRRLAVGALVTLGLLLIVPEFSLSDKAVQGLLWGLASGASFAWLAVSNRASALTGDSVEIAFWQNAAAAACLLPLALWMPPSPTAVDIALLAVLGIVCTAAAHTLFISALGRLSAHTASVVAALEPVYGIVLALALLGEVPMPRTVLGGALVVSAAVLAVSRPGAARDA